MTRKIVVTAALAAAAGQAFGQFPIKDDIAVGLSVSNAVETVRLYTPGGAQKVDAWDAFTFAQSVEWDNSGGILHNPDGRLLAVNFGTTATGGSIYVYQSGAANGWNGVLAFGCTSATTCGPVTFSSPGLLGIVSRLGGLSISPDNTGIAVVGSDSGQIYVLDYDAVTSSLSNPRQSDALPVPLAGGTSGTVWLDNDTIFGVSPDGNMVTANANASPLAPVSVGVLPGAPAGGSRLASCTYTPQIAGFIYVSISDFQTATGITTNRLYAVNPATFAVVAGPIDFSTSHPTSREIALASNGDLYFSTFDGNGVPPNPEGGIFRVSNVTNPGAILPNSSVQVVLFGTPNSSFNGIDVAAAVPEGGCYPDCDGMNGLTVQDFGCFQTKFVQGDPYADCDGVNGLTVQDFGCFQTKFVQGCP
jgi:hypothetical protein